MNKFYNILVAIAILVPNMTSIFAEEEGFTRISSTGSLTINGGFVSTNPTTEPIILSTSGGIIYNDASCSIGPLAIEPNRTYPGLGMTGTTLLSLERTSNLLIFDNYRPLLVGSFFTPFIQKYVNLTQPQFSSLNETHSRLGKEMKKLRGRFSGSQASKSQTSRNQKKQTASAYQTPFQDLPVQLVSTPLPIFSRKETASPNKKVTSTEQEIAQTIEKEKTERLTEALGSDLPWNFYMGTKGQIGNVISKKDTQGYKDWSVGAFSGFDYAFSQIGVGLIAEYERIKADVGNYWGNFVIDNVHADVYATYAPSSLPEFSINGILGGGYEWYSIKRSFQGAEFDTLLGVEYVFKKSAFSIMPEKLEISPLASVQYMYIHIDSYKDRDSAFSPMNVSQQNQKSLRSTLGMRVNYEWDSQNVKFSPELTLSWQREFLDKERSVHFTPIEWSNFGFSRKIPESGRNIALIGADFLVTLYDRHGLETGYDFEYNSLYHTHFMYLSYNVRF
ncbi:MAG: autotransporter outer membrane beta-barrel domain-containing protein [Chlamydiae bacterium]|nr:autotransporter outer membrane beta-barrel domain-containing protein [Chlamydiota bacterium]